VSTTRFLGRQHWSGPRAVLAVGLACLVVLTGCGPAEDSRTESSAAGPPARRGVSLPDATAMGTTQLVVRDLDTVARYYTDAVGMEPLGRSGDVLRLGYDDEPILELAADRGASSSPADGAGLYHTAILFPDEQALADVLVRVVERAPRSYAGASDHLVSQAFYFTDPEGNGIELYVDRPRDAWTWRGGEVQMASAPLDARDFVSTHASDPESAPAEALGSGGTVGHMHLSVGDLAAAEEFYADVVGFDVVSRVDDALFMSAGGYHHHLAVNTWGSAGAGTRSPDEAGLGFLTVRLPEATPLEPIARRLEEAGVQHRSSGRELRVEDPWGTVVVLRA
jgi:catechol 2,3-dioxygenase